MTATSRCQPEGGITGNVKAVEVFDGALAFNRQILGRARELSRKPDAASPSLSCPSASFVTCPSWAPSHCSANCTGSLVQIGRALHVPSIASRPVSLRLSFLKKIGPHRLGFYRMPQVFSESCHKAEIGFCEGVGFFSCPNLKLMRPLVGLLCRGSRRASPARLRRRRNRSAAGAPPAFPSFAAAFAVSHQVNTGSVRLRRSNLQPSRNSELTRTVAITSDDCSTGSAPKLGSSWTTKFSRSKQGWGNSE